MIERDLESYAEDELAGMSPAELRVLGLAAQDQARPVERRGRRLLAGSPFALALPIRVARASGC
jgi:hypothetical protein